MSIKVCNFLAMTLFALHGLSKTALARTPMDPIFLPEPGCTSGLLTTEPFSPVKVQDSRGREIEATPSNHGVEVSLRKGGQTIQRFSLDLGGQSLTQTQLLLSKNLNGLGVWFQTLQPRRAPSFRYFSLGNIWNGTRSSYGSTLRTSTQGWILGADPNLFQREFHSPYLVSFVDSRDLLVLVTQNSAVAFAIGSAGVLNYAGDTEIFVTNKSRQVDPEFNRQFWQQQRALGLQGLSMTQTQLILRYPADRSLDLRLEEPQLPYAPLVFRAPQM